MAHFLKCWRKRIANLEFYIQWNIPQEWGWNKGILRCRKTNRIDGQKTCFKETAKGCIQTGDKWYQRKLGAWGKENSSSRIWSFVLSPRNSSRARKWKERLVSCNKPPFQHTFLKWLLASPKNTVWLPGKPTGKKGLGLWVLPPTSDLQGGERGWRLSQSPMANDLITHPIWWNLCKTQKSRVHGVFWSVSRWRCENGVHRAGKLHPFPSHAPYVSSIWVFLLYPLQ